MDLGQRLRQARLEAGMSQRQLCGDTITRNMLSQIENGTARPSMDTLRFLAQRLGKPMGYFLEEQVVTSPNQAVMRRARQLFEAGDYQTAAEELAAYQAPDETFDRENYRAPDPLFDQERQLLLSLSLLHRAMAAAGAGKTLYALELLRQLEHASRECIYWDAGLERSRLVLLASLQPEAAAKLPGDDDALLARARHALMNRDYPRAAQYLDAAADRGAEWSLLRGEASFALGAYAQAAEYFNTAEQERPDKAIPWLEKCYKEMGDYKRAYEYAYKRR